MESIKNLKIDKPLANTRGNYLKKGELSNEEFADLILEKVMSQRKSLAKKEKIQINKWVSCLIN